MEVSSSAVTEEEDLIGGGLETRGGRRLLRVVVEVMEVWVCSRFRGRGG